ncbi:MAG: hypothetical protein RBS07_15800 [Lentimicrobium sp.]|jgi:hypothetical protein|nr:hypothetical protein [Lentimicrobium sp.]
MNFSKNHNILFFLLLGFLLVATGCRELQPVVKTQTVEVEVIKERLVPVVMPADSTQLFLRLKCDSLNNVLLEEISELKSDNVTTSFKLIDNKLVYKTKTVHDTVFIPVVDTFYSKIIETQKVETLKKTKLGWLSKVGIFYLSTILAGLLVFLYNVYKKFR